MTNPSFHTTEQPATKRGYVIPPSVQADRMHRYSIYLVATSFLIVGANYQSLTMTSVLWFAAGITAAFSLLCAICVVVLHAVAWNFDRLLEEMKGGRKAQAIGTPDPSAPPRPSGYRLPDDDVQ
jgi:hypothetical protein